MAGAAWPLISVTALQAGLGPAVIQVGFLPRFVFLMVWFHETIGDTDGLNLD